MGKSVNQGMQLILNEIKMTQRFNCPSWAMLKNKKKKKVIKHFVTHDEKQIGAQPNSANFLQAKFS